ncbi:hypothetical protein DDE05_56945 [Streptomyces cavourensis]|nr:hypothetical protein DDE05_56945 [Streptomyces cavourensis]
MKNNKFLTSKMFGAAAMSVGFCGTRVTRSIEYDDYWLLINHQKSQYSKFFYINVCMVYKGLIFPGFTEQDAWNLYKKDAGWFPHVAFRLENCPGVPTSLMEDIDRSVECQDEQRLKEILVSGLRMLLNFMEDHHSRESIRRLSNEKKLSAIVCKEV